MPALASHRKERSRTTTSPAVGLTTAAIAGVTLLSTQSANAVPTEPKPSIEEVQKKVDDLYRQAGTATEKYNKAKESTDEKRREVDELLDEAATRTDKLNESRRALGNYAAAQYRTGAVAPTAALLFADSPQAYFDQTQLMDRMTDRQRTVIDDYENQRAAAAKQRATATEKLESLTLSQKALRTSKQEVQSKLAEARALLSKLTAEEKARLAAIERQKQEEARLKAEAKAKAEAEAEARAKAEEAARQQQEAAQRQDTSTGTSTGTGTGTGTADSYAAKADKVLAFARAQIGKPYVWGASGPSSYDCSGLTQAAWKAAGVDLPRTTWDQVNVGTRVATKDLLPGDLVFFYDDISHVGIYIGDGMMIHAPKPGTNVREESIYYMPIYGSVRPA
ncbi:cell wall-associated NlpC family hydrolase [Streptomyces sp. SLBN-118]|uniref:C40 family peptidase n=1 Tax=Streptomyces sp. SLBN-118 TaxID=2768454 RepID=UPI0011501F12|nr:C40 family peptidase [Streptomyces sp. SLBN-118]TQK52381.1 cell wall-associated NlpC family hydrolase [Streptomyces sp. SLBN-118]